MSDPTSLPNFPPPADESPLRGRVLDVLQDDGFRADIDADGDVSFKVEGTQLFVKCLDGDVPLMRVFGQWAVPDEISGNIAKILNACNDVTLSLNIIKTGIANGNLVVTGEHLVNDGADLQMLLHTSIQMVQQAVQLWNASALGPDSGHVSTGGQPVFLEPGEGGQQPS
ncbi:hypothetical protein ACMYYO_05025 [Dermacoccaceae bacterium W4C1]